MNLQPLYDVKERLEYAAIAGVSLLGEDFRLQRAAEGLKPLAAASPVFGKIDAGLGKLLSAPADQRPGLLLDVLALVDAVAYTQARTGVEGELEPLPTGGGRYYQISYGQIQPLLTALTTTGGGRVEVVKAAWERCADYFLDYRVLPAVVGGLGDSYGEMAELCATLLKKLGAPVVPMLKQGFDPAGKKEMARRVEVLAAVEGAQAAPWLREILPQAKKDVRAAVIRALGVDSGDASLLLDLAKSERGANRDAALEALARQDGPDVRAFWEKELAEHSQSVKFLQPSNADWASDLVARRLWDRMEEILARKESLTNPAVIELRQWFSAALGKSSPSMLDFWRWTDARLADIDHLRGGKEQRLGFGREVAALLLESLCAAGPGPLCGLCLELWERHPKETRYLPHAVVAALMTRSAAEVYDIFSSYVPTIKPLLGGEQKKALHSAVLKGLGRLSRDEATGVYQIDNAWPAAQPLDRRWVKRLTHAVWKTTGEKTRTGYGGDIEEYDKVLMGLLDPSDQENRQFVIAHLREQVAAGCCMYNYCRDIFRLGGDPVGVLGPAMQKHSNTVYLSHVLDLLALAQERLPTAQVIQMAKEFFVIKAYQPGNQGLVKKSYPYVIAALEAGEPVPSFERLRNMG